MTNTNWQAYAGETGVTNFTQMIGMNLQNFLSAATGISVAVALTRGFVRNESKNLGNFWVDMIRSTVYVLLPLSIIISLFLVSQGVVQTFSGSNVVTTLEGAKQVILTGPVASQEAIKLLGTNGGGFFNANSAHPFENPTALSNYVEAFSILIIPAALILMFGRMTGKLKNGVAIYLAVIILFAMTTTAFYISETAGAKILSNMGLSSTAVMEGKEVRFGAQGVTLFSIATTAASCGAVNSSMSSLTPAAGMIAMLQILLGEVIFGGVGAGLYGIMLFVIFTVFIVGLMVGRTPEFLGKKIEAKEIKMAITGIVLTSMITLFGTALALSVNMGTSSILNSGSHGISEVMYAFGSSVNNNGSAFAGLNANTAFYNILLGISMIIGRFGVIIPVMVIAGSLAGKKSVPESAGSFDTGGLTFTVLLILIILVMGALTFLPALCIGPILEQLTLSGM